VATTGDGFPPDAHRRFVSGLAVTAQVQAAGIPAGSAIPTREGRSFVRLDGGTLALLTFVAGAELVGDSDSEQRRIGPTLAGAHRALIGQRVADADTLHWIDPASEHLAIRDWVRPAIAILVRNVERGVASTIVNRNGMPCAMSQVRRPGRGGRVSAVAGRQQLDGAHRCVRIGPVCAQSGGQVRQVDGGDLEVGLDLVLAEEPLQPWTDVVARQHDAPCAVLQPDADPLAAGATLEEHPFGLDHGDSIGP
jgi:hypothetical protein